MVVSARMTTGLSGLRNRNARVTNKTQLRVVRGNVEADPIILDDDDDEKNRILASQGVEDEDANEHHLQAALNASYQRTSQLKSDVSKAFIPTPDAAGLVKEYNDLYPPRRYKDPTTHLRFSDTIDETFTGGLAGSYTYFLDERDHEWLMKYNASVKGEGTSANGIPVNPTTSPTLSLRNVSRASHGRNVKSKGKEPDNTTLNEIDRVSTIDDDHFELTIGLLEKWTDETVSPYLHLAPEHFPDFKEYHNFLSKPLPSSTFTNFDVPAYVPSPERMVELGKAVYPWWKERRMERGGHRIVPQLHILVLDAQEKESRTDGSPYTCFRKREVKPMRRTRTNIVTHTERLTRLRLELLNGLELAQMVLQREKLKRDSMKVAADVWRGRGQLADYMKQMNLSAPGSVPPADELLLFDKEKKLRKKVETSAAGRIILAANRRASHIRGLPDPLDPHSALALSGDTSHAFEECQKWPSARTTGIQREVERELVKARKEDAFWEDLVDVPYQPMTTPPAEKYFRRFSPADNGFTPSSPFGSSQHDQSPAPPSRSQRSWRLRTGRGGRLILDRRSHTPRIHRLLQREWASHPPRADEAQGNAERWASRTWRPRDTSIRYRRLERVFGAEYFQHSSIYGDRVDGAHGEDQTLDFHDPTLGFEQSIQGWEGRGLWARGRMSRDDEGWKPTPHLAVDPDSMGMEMATRNAAERERIVETWRGQTAEASNVGGALALFTDGGPMNVDGDIAEERDEEMNEPPGNDVERGWRVESLWRFDPEHNDADDRFLLDDYQAKYLRTTITLLDARDHETIQTDPQLVPPLPVKPNRYMDHQLRLQHSALPQLSSAKPLSVPQQRQMPLSSQTSSVIAPHVQSRPASDSATSLLQSGTNGASSGYTLNGAHAAATSPRPSSVYSVNGSRVASVGSEAGLTARSNNFTRPKQSSNGLPMSQPSPSVSGAIPSNPTDALPSGTLSGSLHNTGYPLVKTTLDRVAAAQQDMHQLHSTRAFHLANGVNGKDHPAMNVSLGVGNLQLKLPPQRRINGENGIGSIPSENPTSKQSMDVYSLPQHLALPRLPSTGTRAT